MSALSSCEKGTDPKIGPFLMLYIEQQEFLQRCANSGKLMIYKELYPI
jgi:hypothetical protein